DPAGRSSRPRRSVRGGAPRVHPQGERRRCALPGRDGKNRQVVASATRTRRGTPMTLDAPKRVRMFAGPNGSGKTSLVRKLAREFTADGLFQLHQFINADSIFRDLQEGRGVAIESLGRTVEQ